MKGKWIFLSAALVLCVLVASVAMGQVPDDRRSKSYVINSVHNLRNDPRLTFAFGTFQVCSFCHTAHQDPVANAIDPLWNHQMSTVASYGVYGSTTLNATPADLGGQNTVSNLCLGCHDGTVGINSTFSPVPGLTTFTPVILTTAIPANPLTHNGLTDDHPVNFTYDAALANADGGIIVPVSTAWVDAGQNFPLFGGYMQCSTCHDAHNGRSGVFIRQSNSGTLTLCLDCHA